MGWIDDNKGTGPWDFTEQPDKFAYLNNPRWSSQQDAIDFCETKDLPLDDPNQHLPCGHWHKVKVSEDPFSAGKWVAAMQQPGTPYIYVYDIVQKAVIRIDTSEIPVFVSGRLELESTYDLDYDMGYGNPGAQRGGYCMNKSGTRIWYLFCDQGLHPITRDHPDAQLVEVDISHSTMRIVKKTLFPNLLPADSFPGPNEGRVSDGCSNDTYTYWCTQLIAGRIIKIRNNDHSIVDDHAFNYPLIGAGGSFDQGIASIDVYSDKLYWVYCRDHLSGVPIYNACRHLIRSDTDLVEEVDNILCGSGFSTPGYQNMIRIYSGFVLHHRAYHPSIGYLMKRNKSNFSLVIPTSYIVQEYLQNIFGVKSGKLFTFIHDSSIARPAYLYCIDFSDMTEVYKLDISYYAGQGHLKPYDWDWTSVSAMNYQTGVIAIFRYHNVEEKNYVGCFDANSGLELLCDVPLYSVRHDSGRVISDEPMIWSVPE